MSWRAADITVELDDEMSEDDIATGAIGTPAGCLTVMARVAIEGRTIRLSEVHVHSPDGGPNSFGWHNLRRAGKALLEWFGSYDELVVEGAVRTSGANPGRRPSVIRIARDLRPEEEPP